ncbi:MAG: cytochrome c5 family protein [Gammaproteobacteria bacterium]
MSSEHDNARQDAVFIRNFATVLAGLTVIFVVIVILARVVYDKFAVPQDSYTAGMEERLAPVGQVNSSGEPVTLTGSAPAAEAMAPASAPAAAASPGEAAYNKVCFACHAQGIAGAPKMGDAAAWETRLAQGNDTLYKHAIEGFTGQAGMMPPKGGAVDMSDDDIKAAVDFMVKAVQGGGADAAATPAPAAAADTAPAADAAAPAVADTSAKGKEIYDAVCFACHTPGAAGAPKLGDAAAWGPRIAKGMDMLYDHSINGFMGEAGLMPPKGGRPDFADADIKAAVDYMTANSK